MIAKPEPERSLTVHIDTFKRCHSKLEADLLLLSKLREAGFRLQPNGSPEPDYVCVTSESGQTITVDQWPSGTIKEWEMKNGKV